MSMGTMKLSWGLSVYGELEVLHKIQMLLAECRRIERVNEYASDIKLRGVATRTLEVPRVDVEKCTVFEAESLPEQTFKEWVECINEANKADCNTPASKWMTPTEFNLIKNGE